MEDRFASFEAFWPFYVREHSQPLNRWLHFAGTTLAVLVVGFALASGHYAVIPLALLAGYGPAWIGHFTVEKNRPATFKYPLWSLRADFVMWAKMVRGQMEAEVARCQGVAD